MKNLELNPDQECFGSTIVGADSKISSPNKPNGWSHMDIGQVTHVLREVGLPESQAIPPSSIVVQNVDSQPGSGWFRYTQPRGKALQFGKLEGIAGGFFMGGKVRGELLGTHRGWQTMHGFVPHLDAADSRLVTPLELDSAVDELIAESLHKAKQWAETAFGTPQDLAAARTMLPKIVVTTYNDKYSLEWDSVHREVDGPCVILNSVARPADREGNELWAEIWLYAYNDLSKIEFELLIGYHDVDASAVSYECSLALSRPQGLGLFVSFPSYHGLSETYGTGGDGELWQNITFGDAQAQAIRGFLCSTLPPYHKNQGRIVAVSNAWRAPLDTGNGFNVDFKHGLGVLGITPYPYAKQDQTWGTTEQILNNRFVPRIRSRQDPWAYPGLGLHAASGDTGDQDDFHVLMAPEVFGCSHVPFPAPILEYWHAASCEARRPNHFRGGTGRRLVLDAHPEWVTFSGYTHHSSSVSPDRLGKGPAQWMYWSGNWRGPDREHWSNNRLCTAFWLTGSYLLESLIQDQALVYLSGETIDISLPTSHAGAARGIGRTCWAALNILLSLSQHDQLGIAMLVRLNQRLALIFSECQKPESLQVRPLVVMDPHPNNLGGRCKFWTPWEHSVGIIGLLGCAMPNLLDSAFAKALLAQVLQCVIRVGWVKMESTQTYEHCKAVEWLDGQLYGEQETYSGYNRWGSVLVALAAVLDGSGLSASELLEAREIATWLTTGADPITAASAINTWHQACFTLLSSNPIKLHSNGD